MIRWSGNFNGRDVVGLGIEAGNIERLMNGKPIFIQGETVGVPLDIYIHYGATKAELIEQLREAGISEELVAAAERAYESAARPKSPGA